MKAFTLPGQPVDLKILEGRIDQEFNGEAHLTSDEMREVIKELTCARKTTPEQTIAKVCAWLRGFERGIDPAIIAELEEIQSDVELLNRWLRK